MHTHRTDSDLDAAIQPSQSLPHIEDARKVLEAELLRYRNQVAELVSNWCSANSDIVERAWVLPEDFSRDGFVLKVAIMHPSGVRAIDQSDRITALDVEIATHLPESVWCDAWGVDFCTEEQLVDRCDPSPEFEIKVKKTKPT